MSDDSEHDHNVKTLVAMIHNVGTKGTLKAVADAIREVASSDRAQGCEEWLREMASAVEAVK